MSLLHQLSDLSPFPGTFNVVLCLWYIHLCQLPVHSLCLVHHLLPQGSFPNWIFFRPWVLSISSCSPTSYGLWALVLGQRDRWFALMALSIIPYQVLWQLKSFPLLTSLPVFLRLFSIRNGELLWLMSSMLSLKIRIGPLLLIHNINI